MSDSCGCGSTVDIRALEAGQRRVLMIVLAIWLNTRDTPEWTLRYLTTYMLVDAGLLFFVSAVLSDGILFIVQKGWQPPAPENTTP